jgi:hypothetical protein
MEVKKIVAIEKSVYWIE